MVSLTIADGKTTVDATEFMVSAKCFGDEASFTRQLEVQLLCYEGGGLPVPEVGAGITFSDEEGVIFRGMAAKRSLASDRSVLTITALDDGLRLHQNDGNYKFRGASPGEVARRACADAGVPVASLAETTGTVTRKFTNTPMDQIIRTAYTLAGGGPYFFRMTPEGLVVGKKGRSPRSVMLRPRSNLIRATTTESVVGSINKVLIYDKHGRPAQEVKNEAEMAKYGKFSRHITVQSDLAEAMARADKLLLEGGFAQQIQVEALGDRRILTGDTVVVEEDRTGLQGHYFVEADVHTWEKGQYTCRLTLSERARMTEGQMGGDVDG